MSVLFSVEEVASMWGVSGTTVRRCLYRGEFPNAFKVGRLWKIPEGDVEDYPKRWRERHGNTKVPRGDVAESAQDDGHK